LAHLMLLSMTLFVNSSKSRRNSSIDLVSTTFVPKCYWIERRFLLALKRVSLTMTQS
jgi:hypothetical protein